MTLDHISHIKSAGFTRLKYLSLIQGLVEDSTLEGAEVFRPLLVAVQELLPSVVKFMVICRQTCFSAERVDEQVDGHWAVEDRRWFIITRFVVIPKTPA